MSDIDPANQVRLVVNGKEYGGWKSVRIEAGIERQARSFELEVTDRWPGQTDIPRRVQPGDACQVFIGSDLVVTGYIDATPIKYDKNTISVGIKGRSKTADLVDCCPIQSGAVASSTQGWAEVVGVVANTLKPVAVPKQTGNQWRNQKMETIAAALAAPYKVRVIAEVDTGAVISDHSIQLGETVFESIDRMMRLRHVLSTDNEQGDLVFIDVGSAGRAYSALQYGANIETGSASLDYTGVFSQYICKGQRSGNDDQFASDVSEEEGDSADDQYTTPLTISDSGAATDSRAKRTRVLVIRQSGQADSGNCQDRAEYERAYRAAKALQTSYTVRGWRQEDGSLWKPNLIVRVKDPMIGFDAEMVIAEVALLIDEQGLRTDVTVGPPDGYRTKAGKLKKSAKGGGPFWSDVK